jgi:hypothetical protein
VRARLAAVRARLDLTLQDSSLADLVAAVAAPASPQRLLAVLAVRADSPAVAVAAAVPHLTRRAVPVPVVLVVLVWSG